MQFTDEMAGSNILLGKWCDICISREIISRVFTVIANVTLIRAYSHIPCQSAYVCSRK